MGSRVAPYAAVVLLAAVLAHAGSVSGGFVYDDHRFIERNPAIASLSNAPSFFTDPSTASAVAGVQPDIYRPLRTLDFAVDRALFGISAPYWHLASVCLHAANAVLVWLLLLRLLSGPAPSGPLGARARRADDASRGPLLAATAGAALFAVHPATVESVAWVSSRGDLLAWTLVLLAFEALSKPGLARTVLGTALVFLACLAKESAIVAFLLLPLRDAALPEGNKPSWRTTLLRTALLCGATGVYVALRSAVLAPVPGLPPFAQIEFPEGSRVAAARGMLAGLLEYARVLVWPAGFPFDRNVFTDPVPASFSDPQVVLGAALLASLLVGGVLAWRNGPRVVAFACLGSLAALLPVSNVLVPLKAFTAERFLYPVLPCLVAGVAYGLLALGRRLSPAGARLLVAGTAAAIVALGVVATFRAVPWRSETALWTAAKKADPMNPRSYEGLGVEWMRMGYRDRAERQLETYLEFLPWDGKAVAELADVMRGVASDLTPGFSGAESESNVAQQRRRALGYEIRLRRKAMDVWTQVGLVRGRGSRALLRSNLERWLEAALAYPDLAEAKRVNDTLIFDDDPTGKAKKSPDRLSVRVRLALRGLLPAEPPPDRTYDENARRAWEAQRTRTRADLLRDVGIEPNLSDRDAAAALLPIVAPWIAARPDDVLRRRERVELISVIVTNLPLDRAAPFLRIALEDLDAIVTRQPDDTYSRDRRETLAKLLTGRR